jgi:pimeloyl-ACP methyl ester carboxylesterase
MTRGKVVAAMLLAAVLAAAAIAALRGGPPGEAASARQSPERLPVLMIHGSGLAASLWAGTIAGLRDAGWPEEYLMAVDLLPADGANIAAAESQLLPAASALLERARGEATRRHWPAPRKLGIVGHSMGAVSGRWLAARLIPDRVALFIGIAGAHHGSNAVCGLPGAGNDEMCPAFPRSGQSEVLEALNGTDQRRIDMTPFGPGTDPDGVNSMRPRDGTCIAWYAVYLDPDEWITPATSARLPGAGGPEPPNLPAMIERVAPGEFRVLERIRHDDLPGAPAIVALVTALLSAGGCGTV